MTATMTIITLPAITISSPNADILQTSIAIRQHQLNICWLVVKLYKISLLLVSKNVLNTKNLVQNVTLEELTLYNTDIMVMSVNVYLGPCTYYVITFGDPERPLPPYVKL